MNNLLILISIIGIPFFILFLYERNIKNKLLKDGVEILAKTENIFDYSNGTMGDKTGLLCLIFPFKKNILGINCSFEVSNKKYKKTIRILKKELIRKNININSFNKNINITYYRKDPNICNATFLLINR